MQKFLVKCAPGTYSSSGVEPCEPCEKGSYQPEEGKLNCLPCSGKKSTHGPGAKNESYCLGKWVTMISFLKKNL
jgi:CUB/sushi domain-containing protein